MRRPASAVVALPSAYPAEHVRLVPGRARPTGPFAIAFVALIIAAAATQMLTPGRGLPANNSRARASTVLPVTAWGPVSRAIGRDVAAYRATPAGARYLISNAQQRLRAQFSPAGVTVRSGRLVLDVRLRADGYGDALRPLAPVAPAAQANRVFYRHGSLQEWYVNGPLGLEQGFTLSSRPAGHRNGPVTLELSLAGNARAVLSDGGQAVTFSRAGASLAYRGLVATDARGRRLPAWLQLRGRQLLLHVNDTGARYPLVIDPFIQQARLTASDGAAGDGLGSSVAVQGNTIVVGAPMSTSQCSRLRDAYAHARAQEHTKVIVLLGGDGYFSNGIHLNEIEAADDPAEESWRNLHAIDDLIKDILETDSHLVISAIAGDAAAGGVPLALAADYVLAREDIILNPYYQHMGGLYGSEYWTYLLPRRVGPATTARLTGPPFRAIGTREAVKIGLLDAAFGTNLEDFRARTARLAEQTAHDGLHQARLQDKRRRRTHDEHAKPLQAYRQEELAHCHQCFFGPNTGYHDARQRFVYKLPARETADQQPARLAI